MHETGILLNVSLFFVHTMEVNGNKDSSEYLIFVFHRRKEVIYRCGMTWVHFRVDYPLKFEQKSAMDICLNIAEPEVNAVQLPWPPWISTK